MNNTKKLKALLLECTNELQANFKANVDIGLLIKQRCNIVDSIIIQLWNELFITFSIDIVAVGGYGRGELHPCSDIDLLILLESEPTKEVEDVVAKFISILWDIGLEIGHSVRTINDTLLLAKSDITIATSLLETRFIAGCNLIFPQLVIQLQTKKSWNSLDFFNAKVTEQKERHAKASAFGLEPNLKTSPGGLRDLQTISWITNHHFQPSSLDELVDHGFLELDEKEELTECRDFLWQLRFALHLITQRNENRLLFGLQLQVAKLMGYQDDTQLGVEQMMKRYYRTVRRVIELNDMLLQRFKLLTFGQEFEKTIQLDNQYFIRGPFIDVVDHEIFSQNPDEILNLFWIITNHLSIFKLASPTLRGLRQARRKLQLTKNDLSTTLISHPACRKLFIKILQHPQWFKAFDLMYQHGVLSAYLPAWFRIEGLMQFDLFHAYTVDEHTHKLLWHLELFKESSQKDKFQLSHVIINQLPKRWILIIAALFHDIAKGQGGNHSELGSTEALDFCQKHEIDKNDTDIILWLIKNHLLMSIVAQRKDISDPEIIIEFTQQIKSIDHLNYLFCLTVADICATSPELWNNWKGSLLRELYFSTKKMLLMGVKQGSIQSQTTILDKQNRSKKELLRKGYQEQIIDKLWARYKPEYFLRHSSTQITYHSEAILKHSSLNPLILIDKHPNREGTELFIYASDRPNLFASVMAILDNKNISVYGATILNTLDNYAVDTFIILEQDGKPVSNIARTTDIKRTIEKCLISDTITLPPFRSLPRKISYFNVATKVIFHPNKNNATLMELITLDAPGLLARFGEVLYKSKFSLLSATISTVGERAEDIFSVQNKDNQPLTKEEQENLRTDLIQALSLNNN